MLLMKDKKQVRNNSEADVFMQDLIKRNPDIVIAKQIMEQSKKTQKPSAMIDQSNYYKLPTSPHSC